MPTNAFLSVPAITELRGVPSVEPMLQVILQAVSGGLPDGASALFLIHGLLQADGCWSTWGWQSQSLSSSATDRPNRGSSSCNPDGEAIVAGVERLEQVRAAGNFMLQVTVRYGLMGGTAAPDWKSRIGRCGCRSPRSRPR